MFEFLGVLGVLTFVAQCAPNMHDALHVALYEYVRSLLFFLWSWLASIDANYGTLGEQNVTALGHLIASIFNMRLAEDGSFVPASFYSLVRL